MQPPAFLAYRFQHGKNRVLLATHKTGGCSHSQTFTKQFHNLHGLSVVNPQITERLFFAESFVASHTAIALHDAVAVSIRAGFPALSRAAMTCHLTLSRPSLTVVLYRQIPLKASAFGCAVSVFKHWHGFIFIVDLLIPVMYIPVKNFLIPKCMKKKMGRPKLPKGEAKAFQIGVRFNSQEAVKIKSAIAKARMTIANWARNALMNAARRND